MPPKPPSSVPLARPMAQALADNAVLASLGQRVRESKARLDAVRECLPPALQAGIKPGPVDDEGWSLLVANSGVAAKLRQLLPRLDDTLRAKGWRTLPIRVKVQAG